MTAQPITTGYPTLPARTLVLHLIHELGNVDDILTDSDDVVYVVADLTPQLARELLSRFNVHNRNLRTTISKNYEADMSKKRWLYAGDPIRFSREGALLDGQHRLLAAANQESERGVKTLFIIGLTAESQEVMDQGRRRSPAQQLALAGVRNAAHVASSTRMTLLWENDLLFRDQHLKQEITTPQIQQYVVDNPEVEEIVSDYVHYVSSTLMTPSALLTFAIAGARIDNDFTKSIIEPLATGSNLPKGSPVLALRNRNIRNKTSGRSDSNIMQLGFLIRTWNYVLAGRQMSKVQLPKGGVFTRDTFPVLGGK